MSVFSRSAIYTSPPSARLESRFTSADLVLSCRDHAAEISSASIGLAGSPLPSPCFITRS
jgi:hypothetical protein